MKHEIWTGGKCVGWLLAAVVCVAAAPVWAVPTYSFTDITHNNETNAMIGEAQLLMKVEGIPGQDVSFTFRNTGPLNCSICDVYFDDGSLLGLAALVRGEGVIFEQGANPPDLPGGNSISPPFEVTEGFLAQASAPHTPDHGVNPGEWLTIVFSLEDGQTYDVLDDLHSGDLRVGLHVQAFCRGGSESFVTGDVPPSSAFPCPVQWSWAPWGPA